jgi:predicted ATPase with chaperone activity
LDIENYPMLNLLFRGIVFLFKEEENIKPRIENPRYRVKNVGLMNQRPFRSPHHTISNVTFTARVDV